MLLTVVNFCKQIHNSQYYNFFKIFFGPNSLLFILLSVGVLYIRAMNAALIDFILTIIYEFNRIHSYGPSITVYSVTAKYIDLSISFNTVLHGIST